ncbi:L,D-transpeptidase family protein [Alkalihalobacillus trypoxylicola]|uniref:L,D-transpeptidase n=1 Tax=Alkalihalobacillus trypoxylicola TaxID=519424 RepID=A0A161P5B1_9BACI|nr:L,D-transpeptidase family protein [Alkalihalobacillus trypoxylicola]KYG26059.1 L,D-transpeptidase [Alkalihalobacillus trypoxylicola]
MYYHTVMAGETLGSISLDYRVPLSSIIQANQLANPNFIMVGQRIYIPGIPDPSQIPYEIYIKLSDRVLTLYRDQAIVKTYPIAVGRMLTETPLGEFVIINKAPNPGGPFGAMWMSISRNHYGIHGTNNPSSIGTYASKGCVRMFNEDVVELASIVPIGTRVVIEP